MSQHVVGDLDTGPAIEVLVEVFRRWGCGAAITAAGGLTAIRAEALELGVNESTLRHPAAASRVVLQTYRNTEADGTLTISLGARDRASWPVRSRAGRVDLPSSPSAGPGEAEAP